MRPLAITLLFAAAACGGEATIAPPAPNSVTGKVRGQPLAKVTSVAVLHTADPMTPGDYPQLVVLVTTDLAAGCGQLAGNPKSARSFLLALASLSGKTWSAPGAVGSFAITEHSGPGAGLTDGRYATAVYLESDASCGTVKANAATGTTGSVVLTKAGTTAGDELVGTFDVIIEGGDRLLGTFDTTLCGAATAGTCQ